MNDTTIKLVDKFQTARHHVLQDCNLHYCLSASRIDLYLLQQQTADYEGHKTYLYPYISRLSVYIKRIYILSLHMQLHRSIRTGLQAFRPHLHVYLYFPRVP
jgi:hypothetical protein